MQEFLLQQVKERRINEELAWLYGRCLLPETLDNEELTAVAELLFTRKVTCEDRRIRQIKVVHAQLERPQIVPLQMFLILSNQVKQQNYKWLTS